MIGLPNRHHNYYSRNLRPAIPSDLDPNTHFVGVRLISTGGKPLCQTRFSLSCAISMHGLFFTLLSVASAALSGLFTHISHQHSIIGRRCRESFLSVLGCWLYCTYIFRTDRLQGFVYIPASGGCILEYLLCCTEGLPTRLCNELSVSLVSCANRVRRKSPCVSNILHSVLEYIALRLIMRFLLIFVCIPQVFSSL